ncbi:MULTISPECIES: hypothetical protein [Bacillus cereus group]|uniref:hypothetical protein n=1 Tax=Bacillus cereus group TaxID=86661 RepID=UPI0001A0C691|nr:MULTISPECIES: hypothetical protein [Bacillus cereus group]EEL31106.1 hypothetical protein bcere0019_57930 [Bacillus cereus Rock3-28]MBJ7949828.1 hypothetical protein [Bacillus cereus group sp. N24]MBJ8133190.1 hypothetical protein [Bacillus cereus group sp. N3]OSM10200.1 hypothetical protein BTH38_26610 [Bacillus toyonensis]PEB28687.1 hypothetical protein COO14_19740 [Bacillus toyonensis]
MKSMKNVILLVVCFIFLSGCNSKNEAEVQEYIKEKHGIDVDITEWGSINENNFGNTYHTVQEKDNKCLKFRVKVQGFLYSSIVGDEYKYGEKTYEEYKKFQPTLEEIKKLGYVETEEENALQYLLDNENPEEGSPTDELLLTLKMSNEIDFSQLDSVELDRLYALFQLIQKNNKKITELEIKDQNGKSLGGPFKNVQNIITKEELLLTMKTTMSDTINKYWEGWIRTHTKVVERLYELQNDRFAIKGITYISSDDEDSRKYSVTLVINTTNNIFENNPPLIEDLIKVTTILKEELYNKNFNIYLTNKTGTINENWLSSKEIKEANNIEDLVKERDPAN